LSCSSCARFSSSSGLSYFFSSGSSGALSSASGVVGSALETSSVSSFFCFSGFDSTSVAPSSSSDSPSLSSGTSFSSLGLVGFWFVSA